MSPVSEIKLIRTDTTLDLSQKAEKVYFQVEMLLLFKSAGHPRGLWVQNPGGGGASDLSAVSINEKEQKGTGGMVG